MTSITTVITSQNPNICVGKIKCSLILLLEVKECKGRPIPQRDTQAVRGSPSIWIQNSNMKINCCPPTANKQQTKVIYCTRWRLWHIEISAISPKTIWEREREKENASPLRQKQAVPSPAESLTGIHQRWWGPGRKQAFQPRWWMAVPKYAHSFRSISGKPRV